MEMMLGKSIYRNFLLSSFICFSMAYAEDVAIEDLPCEGEITDASHVFLMGRVESLPNKGLDSNSDHYLEGYIQALVDMHFYEHQVVVLVEDHIVYLYNLPNNALLSNSIVSFVQDLPCVCEVRIVCELTPEQCEKRKAYVEQPYTTGVWFPQSTVLFQPLIADPRQVMYYASWRGGDRIVGKKAAAVALGDDFPIYRWRNVFRWCGDLQIGLEAGIWAVFNFHEVPHRDGTWCELVNTDYLLGIPLTYAVDRWSFRLRVYHISSHLGDEFICNRPHFVDLRANPSFEAIDFFTSYQFSRTFRGYLGPGVILHSDRSFDMKTFYVEYGAEWRFYPVKFDYQRLYGTPFIAVDVQNWQVRHWKFDYTVMGGYEISKLAGVGRKMRLFGLYHHGFSYEGQFFKRRTHYWQVGLAWGF